MHANKILHNIGGALCAFPPGKAYPRKPSVYGVTCLSCKAIETVGILHTLQGHDFCFRCVSRASQGPQGLPKSWPNIYRLLTPAAITKTLTTGRFVYPVGKATACDCCRKHGVVQAMVRSAEHTICVVCISMYTRGTDEERKNQTAGQRQAAAVQSAPPEQKDGRKKATSVQQVMKTGKFFYPAGKAYPGFSADSIDISCDCCHKGGGIYVDTKALLHPADGRDACMNCVAAALPARSLFGRGGRKRPQKRESKAETVQFLEALRFGKFCQPATKAYPSPSKATFDVTCDRCNATLNACIHCPAARGRGAADVCADCVIELTRHFVNSNGSLGTEGN